MSGRISKSAGNSPSSCRGNLQKLKRATEAEIDRIIQEVYQNVQVPRDLSKKELVLREKYQQQRKEYQEFKRDNGYCMFDLRDSHEDKDCHSLVPDELRKTICKCGGVFCAAHARKKDHECSSIFRKEIVNDDSLPTHV